MSLRQTLTAMMALRPAHYRAMLEAVTASLRNTALRQAIKIGSPMPDFVLPNDNGELVFSGDLLARGPLVVVFFRGDWCPFCKTTLTALDTIVPDIAALGASLVALTLDTGEFVASDRQSLRLRFPVLSDVDGGTALQFGMLYRVPDDLRAFYEGLHIDIGQRHGDSTWYLPVPATFLVDRTGIVRHIHASGDVTDRMEPAEILSVLREMAASP
jgi:peroxiredoxin